MVPPALVSSQIILFTDVVLPLRLESEPLGWVFVAVVFLCTFRL
jgi:hypothetical protein